MPFANIAHLIGLYAAARCLSAPTCLDRQRTQLRFECAFAELFGDRSRGSSRCCFQTFTSVPVVPVQSVHGGAERQIPQCLDGVGTVDRR